MINYALADISSWGDIHAACGAGRIVAVSDTAGRPRYRRTTVRGLVSLKPHWAMCCVAAGSAGTTTAGNHSSASTVDVVSPVHPELGDFKTHLELCLTLDVPLLVVITKMDATSVVNLRSTLTSILTTLKTFHRQPCVLPSSSQGFSEPGSPQILMPHDIAEAQQVLTSESFSPRTHVPIVMTSAVTGRGMGTLHAILRHLPILGSADTGSPPPNGPSRASSPTVFNIDEVFGASNTDTITLHDGRRTLEGYILCGHLSAGSLLVGDELWLGPFVTNPNTKAASHEETSGRLRNSSRIGELAVEPSAAGESASTRVQETTRESSDAPSWFTVRVVSLRYLRQPVRTLDTDHCGTAGVVLANSSLQIEVSKIRKGMVMSSTQRGPSRHAPPAYRGFVARFAEQDVSSFTEGIPVTVYTSSIRALATVTPRDLPGSISKAKDCSASNNHPSSTNGSSVFDAVSHTTVVHIGFTFVNSYEFFRRNDTVLIMLDKVDGGIASLGGVKGIITEPLP